MVNGKFPNYNSEKLYWTLQVIVRRILFLEKERIIYSE